MLNHCVEAMWNKSSYSHQLGDCVDVGRHKSSYSGNNGQCVEIECHCHNNNILVRDTKDKGNGLILEFDTNAWRHFLDAIKEDTLI